MRIGLMVGTDKERTRADRLAGLLADGAAADASGFTSFWFPQVPGYLDAMTVMALLGQRTSTIELGTAVVPIQTRHPMIMAQQALTTQTACTGRFTLGLGVSHDWIINGQLGIDYERPARLLRDHIEALRAAFDGPGTVDVDNAHFRVHHPRTGGPRPPQPRSVDAEYRAADACRVQRIGVTDTATLGGRQRRRFDHQQPGCRRPLGQTGTVGPHALDDDQR